MPIEAVCLHIDAGRVVEGLEEALESLHADRDEISVDLSAVRLMDVRALQAMEALAAAAAEKRAKVVLRGVNIDMYRMLKLVHLAQRFSVVA